MENVNTETKINPIVNHPSGVNIDHKDDAWGYAIDCVSYPVILKELFWYDDSPEAPHTASGVTNTGRDVQFYGVVVDKDRVESYQTIAVVTGLYDTIAASEVYSTLKDDFDKLNVDANPYRVYVAGNGGAHELSIKIADMEWINSSNTVNMHMVVNTSVDGSKRHSVRLAAVDGDGVEVMAVSKATFNLSARHTKTIRERHAAFSTVITTLIDEWNKSIIPFMELMNECEFNKTTAMEILSDIMDNADIPDKHQENALRHYESLNRQNDTLYGAIHGVSSYFSRELADKPERLNKFREDITKKSQKTIQKVIDKMT